MPEQRGRPASVAPRPPVTVEGLVVRTESGFHRVQVGDRVIVSRAPKRLLSGERTTTTPVVIGDQVRVRLLADGTGVIEEILPRENELVRGAAGGSRFLDVIAANLDLMVPVNALREPDFNAARLDRFLLLAEAAEIPVVIVLNKCDLVNDSDECQTLAERYRTAGYPVIITSVPRDQGIAELRAAIRDRISAVVGASGVGKSSLLNRVQPGLQLRTAEISEATGKGRHTTTTAELIPLQEGGYIADTPGLRELAIRDVAPEDLAWLFPEFRPYLGQCRFSDCTHREEPDCAVCRAIEEGAISPERYRSYRRVYEELLEQQAY